MPASHTCPRPGCPHLTRPGHTYCPDHQREYHTRRDAARGTTTQRGYGARHQALRAQWAARIQAGQVIPCSRCGTPIHPGEAWHLDHTDDRNSYRGPSHRSCNTAAGGRTRAQRAALGT